jgi:putative CocE/NonD family hydrolase
MSRLPLPAAAVQWAPRMRPPKLALLLPALLALTAQSEPAVQPGGDIPASSEVRPAPAVTEPPRDAQYVRRTAMIPMRDGARLYTVLIIPKVAGRLPILLDRTPYSADKQTSRGGRLGARPEDILAPLDAALVRAGYIVAFEDVRGKFRSEGDYVITRPLRGPLNRTAVDHSTDAWDTIEWLTRNVPEANGRVATIGTSYDGLTALMSLVDPHPALKAAVPINPMVDVWKGDDWFHNGAFRQEMLGFIYGQTASRTSDAPSSGATYDDYWALLRCGSAGACASARGMDGLPFWQRLTRHPAYDDYWQAQALDRVLGARALTVPMLLVGSLWDQEDIYGAAATFAALKASPNAHLVLGPWYHGQAALGPARSLGPLVFGSDTSQWFREHVLLPFLDERLKGGPLANIARVTAFEAQAKRWERLADWPQACARGCPANLTPLYLAAGKQLSFDRPAKSSADVYPSDPARPVPYVASPNLSPWAAGSTWRSWLVDDQSFAAKRSDVVTYTGAPLAQPLRLAGAPLVHLVASTSGSDSDWVVKLIDVQPGGYQLPIAMDVLRGRYRTDFAHPSPVPANQPVTYEFALPNVDYVVAPGHRLMVQVQSSWFPLYDRNPQTYVPNIFFAKPADYRPALQRVFTGPAGSWIGLPVVK